MTDATDAPLPHAAASPSRALKSTFTSSGVQCAATLHLPADAGDQALPAILIVHGWGGVQEALTTPFHEHFTQAGFAVMTFDYPGWGDSEGLPRNVINPWTRVRNAESALAHLKSLPQVDAGRVVLWGTSFGGGHVVDLAAEHPELMGAIAQVPMLDGMAAVKAVPLLRQLRFGLYAFADLLKPGKPIYIPVVAPPGEFASMDRDGANEALIRGMAQAKHAYDNRVAARSVLTMGFYRPFKRLKDIRVRTLIVGATSDTVAPFNEQKLRQLHSPYLEIQSLDANHFDPYFEPSLSTNLGYQLAFLKSLVARKA